MEQVVTQLQQELFTLRAQVAAESGLADAVRAINNLATAQVRKDTPSLIDVKGLGRPKEISGREEDFQQRSKKREARFAGVIMDSEMMFGWAAEQTVEITTTAIDLECRVKRMWTECKTWSLCCSRCTRRSWLSRVKNRTTLSPTRGRIRWRHCGDCSNDMIRRQEGNETFCARSLLLDSALLELQAVIERWESYVSRYDKKLKDNFDDEIKLAGLDALVPEELEKHLRLNSNRLRTFEDARLETVTCVEAKFSFRPWMLMRSTLSRLAKEKGH